MTTLIRTSPELRTLLAARSISELGTWFAYVALTVTVYDRTGSATWVSALLLLDLLPGIALGLLVAPLLDRRVRKHVLVGAELAGAATFAVLAATGSLVSLFVCGAIAGIAGAIVRPGIRAAVPSLVPDEELPRANSLLRSASAVAVLAGPPLAGVIVAVAGAQPVFALNALSFVLSAYGISRIARDKLQSSRSLGTRPSFDGSSLFRAPGLRAALGSWCAAQLAWTLVNVTEVFLARAVFHAGPTGFGLLAASMGLGLLAGSLAAGRLADRAPLPWLYRNALLLAATGCLAAALSQSFALALVGAAVGAAGNALALGFSDLTIQRHAPADRLGQAFGVFQSGTSTAALLALLAAGPIADAVGGRGAWTIAAVVLVVAATLATVLQRDCLPHVATAQLR